MKISDKIYRLRTEHEMTQLRFGEIAGASDKAVSTWERGEKEPRLKSLQKICSYFNIDINEFADETNDIYKAPQTTAPKKDITFDDFAYAMQNETKSLTESDRQLLLSMAKQLNQARRQKDDKSGSSSSMGC